MSHQYLQRLEELLDRTRDVDFFIPDDAGLFQIDDALIRTILALLDEVAGLMEEIGNDYDERDHTKVDHRVELQELAARISSQAAAREIVDLCFVSRAQIQDLMASIEEGMVERRDRRIASDSDKSLRRAGRALIAIESSLRQYEGLSMHRRYWQGLDDALAVRRAYAGLRRKILTPEADGAPPAGGRLRERLREANGEIATLRVSEIYLYLRIDDRLELRRFQERIASWLEQGAEETPGGHLWNDLVSFARLLSEISRRQELREHDLEAVDRIWDEFFAEQETSFAENRAADFDPAINLRPLLGRDEYLDAILFGLRRRPRSNEEVHAEVRPILERLREELRRVDESQDEPSTF